MGQDEVQDEVQTTGSKTRAGRAPLPETQELITKMVAFIEEAGEDGVTNVALAQALSIGTLKASSLGTRLVRQGTLRMEKAENGRTTYHLAEEVAEA